jgi:hypothetical protein
MIAQLPEELVWSQIVAQAWCDEGFMERLLSDPRSVLAEYDVEVPPGTGVKVVLGTEVRVDDTDTVRRFILPARPSHELMEEELGGDPVAWWCRCGACGACGACGCRCSCGCRCF